MTRDQKKAYEWAKNQNYPSVAARYAKELAGFVDELQVVSYARQEQERNATLTPDELREMPCEPVYIVVGCASWWDIVSFAGLEYLYLKVEGSLPFIDYGKNWTAYRQKPEEGAV